jgi:hypothetical protein
MDEMAIRHNGNGGGGSAPASAPAEGSASAAWPDSLSAILLGRVARSEVPARRYWLRFLDAPLAGEIRAAGALDFDELVGAVPRVLRCDEGRISRETIQEWWEYSERRRWLEPVGSLWRLSNKALADLREEHERVNSPDPKRLARDIAHGVIPTSMAGATWLLGAKYLSLDLAVLSLGIVVIIGLLLSAAISRVTDPSTNRWFARRACDWLEGRSTRLAFGANRNPTEFSRLYAPDAREESI